ncbi:deoxyguanylate kinase / guanylate kinase [Campylobacter volucris]|uniref:Guanylate kinase n=1 Tax=Campylobacter volucris TaxID=1031542 RepID=A0AAE5YHI3_9BACT|nr:deoxyguanylate kinase / guanylate kinase [Campylobacter volucris]AJC94367.1 deoxyguanylate kinase / guanylate kinase [Campylobacter volucris LMG 24379]KAB0580515.1 deoxyguanylate kinase / guanylate kinase [Campylobacter volucris]QBL13273.1 deoxyguanylate kinase / guanylate kinase [Campylobacter volucris]QEL08583.1 deoxyguanylate kinase / guanylate kinase [Campylobacter volucris]TXK70309.1 deoxyguanylate kinase / guanylate kinase [Campylobacter volucris]
MSGQILIISGPSGAGKSTLLQRLFKEKENIYFSISSTTRAPRENEKNGVDYHFISEAEFKQGIENGEFLEWALVHKNYYGTSLIPVKKALEDGKSVIFDIDVQGFCIAKEKIPNFITSVFVTTKNKKELEKRLLKRNTDKIEDIGKRLENASEEMKFLSQYDFLIINEDLETSYKQLEAVFEVSKIKSKKFTLEQIQIQWNKGD